MTSERTAYRSTTLSFSTPHACHSMMVSGQSSVQGPHLMVSLGCMLVELLDYRPKKAKDPPLEKPERSRVALHPNDETLWANLCLMNQRSGNKFTDTEVLELEAQILVCYIRDISAVSYLHCCSYKQHLPYVLTQTHI
jgi:hypothetical protein